MINALVSFGISIQKKDDTTILINGGVSKLKDPNTTVFVGNSGTTVRFLTSLCCLINGEITLDGDEHMKKRPIGDLIDGLKDIGVEVDCVTRCPPLTVKSSCFKGGVIRMNGSKSSQYFTSIMMSAPYAESDITIKIEGVLVSLPYVEMTASMMKSFGANVQLTYNEKKELREIFIEAKPYNVSDEVFSFEIEADASAASYAFAAAAVTCIPVSVKTRVLSAKSLQGDFDFVHILERMGCSVERNDDIITVSRSKGVRLTAVTEDMFNISDTVMTLASIAPLVKGPIRINNIANIRIKETDRLIATVTELKRLGQQVDYGDDWLEITPQSVLPADIECYSDHRMAMSFAILGLVKPGIIITDKKCVNKTYPDFWDHLKLFQEYCKTLES